MVIYGTIMKQEVKERHLNLNYCLWLCNCIGVSVSVPENIPASTFIYMILSRDPDLGQEVEVSFFLIFISLFLPNLDEKKKKTQKSAQFLMYKILSCQAVN